MEKADRKKIEEIIRRRTREMTDEKYSQSRGEIFTRDCTERKIRAAEYFAPILEERFGEKYPGKDWNEVSANFSVLSDYSPDTIDRSEHFLYAIIYFILDSIYFGEDRNGMEKLKRILKECRIEDLADDDSSDAFLENRLLAAFHPLYHQNIADDIAELICFRNIDYVNYRNEKRRNGGYSFICDGWTTSLEKTGDYNKDFSVRKHFDDMMALVSERDKEDAIEAYKKLFFELIDCYLASEKQLEKQEAKLKAQREYLEFQIEEASRRIPEIPPEETLALIDKDRELEEKESSFDFQKVNFNDTYAYGSFSEPRLVHRETRSFADVTVPDPYKVIAGYFFLLEKGDDYAWLLSSSTATLGFATELLPWAECEWSDEEDEYRMDNREEKYCVCENFYKDVMNPSLVGLDDTFTPTISPAKYIYIKTEAIPPRYSVTLPDRDKLLPVFGEEMTSFLERSYVASYHGTHSVERESTILEEYVKIMNQLRASKKENAELSEKLREKDTSERKSGKEEKSPDERLLNELNALKESMSLLEEENGVLQRELERKKGEIAHIKVEHENEKEELNSLRELIFASESEKEETPDEDSHRTEWPYETKCSIAVVGGHSDWIAKMKALLPTVKFYGDRIPDRDALKHTDVLWFQTKFSLSHPTFYKVIDMAKNLGLPIRYCRSFGVYSSAEAIADDDRKRGL